MRHLDDSLSWAPTLDLGSDLDLDLGVMGQKILLVIEYPSVKKEKIIKSLLEKLGESSQRCHVSIFFFKLAV